MNELNPFASDTDFSYSNSNMATATKAINTFAGGADEDILSWLQEVAFVKGVIGASEEDTRKLLLLKLRGVALSWAAEVVVENASNIRLESLIELLKQRFSSQQKTEISLSKFLTSKHPTSREEYTELLKFANDLFKKNYMNITLLTQVVINKSPVEVKALCCIIQHFSNVL
ncbi:Paraneoplastic antigen-like protein 5 [Nosema granulosis]|uniref:Paraneoplastic antigen-like protein 5 n=1 Tax=Nosema granulosis TaxID=83296 RepID=A0A9P6KYA6_9MICR|nr:Paraneoplastic antigen-like protein 5 [Nosema granulosis]